MVRAPARYAPFTPLSRNSPTHLSASACVCSDAHSVGRYSASPCTLVRKRLPMGGLRSWRYTEAPHREKGSGTVLTQRSRFCGLESQQRFLTPLPGSGFRPAIGTLWAYPNAVMLVTLETKAPWGNRSRSDFTLLSPIWKPTMNNLDLTLTIFLAASLCVTRVPAQDAAPADRNAVNTAARPGDMMADSPVTFPEQGRCPPSIRRT